MSLEQAVKANTNDFRGIINRQDLYDSEEGTRRLVFRGMGESVTLSFWNDRLFKIRVDLHLDSTEHVTAYLDRLVAEHGPYTAKRSDASSPERLFYIWSDARTTLRFTRAEQYSLSYEDRGIKKEIELDRAAKQRSRTNPPESPFDKL